MRRKEAGISMQQMHNMNQDIQRVLVNETELNRITYHLAEKIDHDYADSEHLLLLCILKGSVVFMSELMRKLTKPVEIDFMRVSSYGAGTTSSKNINIILDIHRSDLSECDVLVIEDIIDSGRTLSYLVDYLRLKGCKSVRTCTLLDKPERREVDFNADYVGLEIPDEFVVGYGLDYDERYRTLPYVGVLSPAAYQK